MSRYNNSAHNYYQADMDELDQEDYDDVPTRPAPPAPYRTIGANVNGYHAKTAAVTQPLPRATSYNQITTRRNVPPQVAGYAAPSRSNQLARPAARNVNLPDWLDLRASNSNVKLAVLGLALLFVLVVSYLLVSFAVQTWQTWQDDMSYGRPRITRLEANVGHNETGGAKTMFLAQNIRGQISILEYPGGDPSKTRVIIGPSLFGKDKDLVPVKLSVKDLNGDSQPDLLAAAADQQLVYINENGSFRPMTEPERAKLKLQE